MWRVRAGPGRIYGIIIAITCGADEIWRQVAMNGERGEKSEIEKLRRKQRTQRTGSQGHVTYQQQ